MNNEVKPNEENMGGFQKEKSTFVNCILDHLDDFDKKSLDTENDKCDKIRNVFLRLKNRTNQSIDV